MDVASQEVNCSPNKRTSDIFGISSDHSKNQMSLSRKRTIVIAVSLLFIFALLILVDGGELTGNSVREVVVDDEQSDKFPTVRDSRSVGTETITGAVTSPTLDASKARKETVSSSDSVARAARDLIDFGLSFDQVPYIAQEINLEEITLHSQDLGSSVVVDENILEVDIADVDLTVENFVGVLILDQFVVSLEGTASRVKVNGVALASGEISLLVDHLDYESLNLKDITVESLSVPEGYGTLTVTDRLTYTLKEDQMTFYDFQGDFLVDRAAEDLLSLTGKMSEAELSGSLLNLGLG